MRHPSRMAVLSAAVVGVCAGVSRAEQFLTPNDFVIAIDSIPNFYQDSTATGGTASMYPIGTESPDKVIDGDLSTKYLNFGRMGGGFIVMPGSSTTAQSLRLWSANDAPERDPTSYVLMGTNAPVASIDRGNGLGEAWTLISKGTITPPTTGGTIDPLNPDRYAPYAPVNLTNSTAYSAYKLYFPTVRDSGNANSMQIGEVQLYDAAGGGGNPILTPADPQNPTAKILGIDNPGSDSGHTVDQRPQRAIDGVINDVNNKYRNNFGSGGTDTIHGAGLIVTPKRGQSVLQSFQIVTAGDVPARDPKDYQIYGTNDPITSEDNSDGNNENWSLIGSGTLAMPAGRLTNSGTISLPGNTTPYTSYKIVFPDTGNDAAAAGGGSGNSLQIAELIFDGVLFGEPEWAVDSSGDWNVGANWVGSVPNAPGATARFLSKSTTNHTVFTDAPVTVGKLVFNNAATYNIGGTGSLTVQTTTGNGSIGVLSGSHKLNLPVTFASSTDINIAAGAQLTLGNPTTIKANKTVTKTGNLQIQAPLTIEAGAALVTAGGFTRLFGAPSMGTGAMIDVKNTQMVIDYGGLGSQAATVRAQLISGYNLGGWNGPGINSSSAAVNANKFAVGYAEASEIFSTFPATFGGQPVSNTSVLVRYTISGDANLSGNVDLTDFTFLAQNFNKQTGASWLNGDFNYDGKVDLTDFTFLAANFNQAVPADAGALGASVPEPASLAAATMLAGLGLSAFGRRSRRRE
jgi:hypothetical protein